MTMESVILVRLETDQAKAALKDLDKQAEASAGRAGASVREKMGGGARALGIGAVGAAVGATGALAATRGGLGTILSENLGFIGANIEKELGLAEKRATEFARGQTIATHGIQGEDVNLNNAYRFQQGIRDIALREEQGALKIRADKRFFASSELDAIVKGVNSIKEVIEEYGHKSIQGPYSWPGL